MVEQLIEPEGSTGDIPGNIRELQEQDESLKPLFVKCSQGNSLSKCDMQFVVRNNILYRVKNDVEQLVVPTCMRQNVLKMGHSEPWAGHLGQDKTLNRIAARFFWPRLHLDVVEFCRTCPQCQLTAPQKKSDRVPMINMPIIDVPFSRIAMDVVGPLPRSRTGNRYILVISDYASRYPEAFALRKVKTRQIANALIQLISRVGIPREVLTDLGTNFTSKQLREVFSLLGIKGLNSTPFHPQTDGLVERFNKTLKCMLKKFVSETGADWDTWLPYLLFAYREVPQASTGFSPFHLLYGREVRGPLDVLKETWEGQGKEQKSNVLSYVLKMRDKMAQLVELVRSNMEDAQHRQKC
uniref:Gypsy retrotransposon integrase-like protein 1 n=1 Tax=Pygocentrus nattereri TaxID=42514 RepID=A0AAR2M2K3_PYGNA